MAHVALLKHAPPPFNQIPRGVVALVEANLVYTPVVSPEMHFEPLIEFQAHDVE